MQLDLNIIFVLSLSNFKIWFFKTFKNAQGIRHHEENMHFFTVCLYNLKCNPSFQAYADYMGFVLSLNKVVKGKKLTCEYKVSEVFNLSLLSVDSKSSAKILSSEFLWIFWAQSSLKSAYVAPPRVLNVTVWFATDGSEVTPAFGDSGSMDKRDSSGWSAITLW